MISQRSLREEFLCPWSLGQGPSRVSGSEGLIFTLAVRKLLSTPMTRQDQKLSIEFLKIQESGQLTVSLCVQYLVLVCQYVLE